jgi:glycosyltransferase involved in cell wall biosynthesis
MRVLAFGSYDADRHPRVAVLLDGLRELGADVDVCNVPLTLDTADRVKILRQPWRLPLLALTILGTWLRLARRARALPKPDAVLVGYLGHFDVLLARRLFPRTPIVHDMLIFAADTAKDRGAGGLKQTLLRRLDAAAIKASDVIVVDTDEHLAMLPDARRADGLVVPVGAPRAWLGPLQQHEGPLRVVFFGLYTPLQAAPVIGEALSLLPAGRVLVTMIGTGQDLTATRALATGPDVTWVDWVSPAELPAVVRDHDVCLGIFAAEGKGTRVVPNKVYQGAAAGCAVVTSDTPPQRRALGDAGCFVAPGDPAALAAALLALADDPALLLVKRTAARTLAEQSFLPAAAAAPLYDRLLREGTA